ncbi:lytic transglycosylase [Frateuria sp. Soil773]|nr:lytic transglycosylase [Frateuria sp. Soil773]
MSDCEADPAILAWARRYTQSPRSFEARMSDALPRIVYVEQSAAKHGVAGEFALLPWVESQFQPVAGRKNRPAGMWQIMPVTARSMGLPVNARYDGRLHLPTATEAVMTTLRRYYDQFRDWRLADYAYNAGEFSVSKLVRRHGAPQHEPVIPHLPVRRVTREHLTKLLAIACVVREPARFHVNLPQLAAGQELVHVDLEHSMPIARAAAHAGMSEDALRDINAAFRGDTIDTRDTSRLLLPLDHAEQFRNAQLRQFADDKDSRTASVTATPGLPPLASDEIAAGQASVENIPALANGKPKARKPRTHTVKPGESLWQIARRYDVGVARLQQWNRLHDGKIKPGQVLRINAPH